MAAPDGTTVALREDPKAKDHRVTIDHLGFPHIIEEILLAGYPDSFIAFRALSKAWRERIEASMFQHLFVHSASWLDRPVILQWNRARIPIKPVDSRLFYTECISVFGPVKLTELPFDIGHMRNLKMLNLVNNDADPTNIRLEPTVTSTVVHDITAVPVQHVKLPHYWSPGIVVVNVRYNPSRAVANTEFLWDPLRHRDAAKCLMVLFTKYRVPSESDTFVHVGIHPPRFYFVQCLLQHLVTAPTLQMVIAGMEVMDGEWFGFDPEATDLVVRQRVIQDALETAFWQSLSPQGSDIPKATEYCTAMLRSISFITIEKYKELDLNEYQLACNTLG